MNSIMVVIEGLDGSGKATQAQLLLERLQQLGKEAVKVSFPNYEDESSALVKMYLRGDLGQADEVNAYGASLFYTVDRYATFQKNTKNCGKRGILLLQTGTPPLIWSTKQQRNQRKRGMLICSGWKIWNIKKLACPAQPR